MGITFCDKELHCWSKSFINSSYFYDTSKIVDYE